MNLFIISPPNTSLFLCFHLTEAVFNCCDYVLVTIWVMMIRKMRLNFHLKVCFFFMAAEYYLFLSGRCLILGYQSGLLYHKEDPEETGLLIAASWFKGFFLIEMLTLPVWVTLDRELSLHFIQDYDYRRRYWIPLVVMLFTVMAAGTSITIYTFVFPLLHLSLFPFLFGLFGISIAGIGLFVHNYRRTAQLNNALKAREPCSLQYSLNVRYQLEENLWLGKIIRNTVVIMAFSNVTTAFAFMGAYFSCFSEEIQQIMDCLYNIFIAANGPLLAFCIFFPKNSYFFGLVKELFMKKKIERLMEDEGDFYFEQLTIQWEESWNK